MSPVIATRQLSLVGPRGKTLVVAFGAPERVNRREWTCRFRIKGLGRNTVRRASGVDALQALLNAIDGVRVALEKTGLRLSWIGGERGDPGFPRFLPLFFGWQFAEKLNRMIDREIESFARKAEARHKQRRA